MTVVGKNDVFGIGYRARWRRSDRVRRPTRLQTRQTRIGSAESGLLSLQKLTIQLRKTFTGKSFWNIIAAPYSSF